jgi:CTP:phosphocholine cytidylyltransferase-like protein
MEYKTTAFSIATETYRKIEWFLSKECSKKIKPINREELRSIFRIILNCRVYFEADDVNTMLKFINAVYGLNAVTITGLEAMKLYRSIQEKLKIRITEKHIEPIIHREGPGHKAFKFKNYDNGNIFQLDKIWNQDF